MRGNNWRGLQNFVKLCLVIKFFYTSTGHALYWMKLIVYWGTIVLVISLIYESQGDSPSPSMIMRVSIYGFNIDEVREAIWCGCEIFKIIKAIWYNIAKNHRKRISFQTSSLRWVSGLTKDSPQCDFKPHLVLTACFCRLLLKQFHLDCSLWSKAFVSV